MRFISRLFAALLGVVLLIGSAVAADDLVRVRDQDTLQALFRDKTLYGHFVDGPDWIEYHRPDGTSSYMHDGCVLRGRWQVANEHVCYRYDADPNEFHCFNVYQRDGTIELHARIGHGDRPVSAVDRMEPGNAEDLPPGGGECLDS